MNIDVSTTPHSRRGCRLSVARHARQPPRGLWLRSNRAGGAIRRELLRIELTDGARPIEPMEWSDGCVLTVAEGDDPQRRAELVFAPDRTVRLRGHGLGVMLSAPEDAAVIAHPAGEGLWTLNHPGAMRRYQFERMGGRLEFRHTWRQGASTGAQLLCMPGDDGAWEIAVDEFTSTWTPRARLPFDEVAQDCRAEFAAFLAAFGRLPAAFETSLREAVWLLWSCIQAPAGLLRRETVFLSLGGMDHVGSWDSGFHAAALAAAHPQLALDQFLVPADRQDEHGAYPDAVNDVFEQFNFSNPPTQGLLLRWLGDRVPGFLTRKRAKALYPTLAAYTRWWLDHRRLPGHNLCHYLHGRDSGWDDATLFDDGVPLIAPDLNALLAVQAETLSETADSLRKPAQARQWKQTADALRQALIDELWRADRFVGRLAVTGEDVDHPCLLGWMPVVLGKRLPAKIRKPLIAGLEGFVTDHGLATEHPDSDAHDPNACGRGPVSAAATLPAVDGLLRCGSATALAKRVARAFCDTCAAGGFADHFDAFTGEPRGDRACTRTADVHLCLARTVLASKPKDA